jgi:PD-(D/E)XK nuclease superfamily
LSMSDRTLQPSASRTALLLECSYPFGKPISSTLTNNRDAADYGSAFHALMAWVIDNDWRLPSKEHVQAAIKEWGLREHTKEELEEHIADGSSTLSRWLLGRNPFKVDFLAKGSRVLVETSFALSSKTAMEIRPPTHDEHVYEDLPGGWLAGTSDLIVLPPRRSKAPLLIIDHKTGQEDFSEPLKKPQLLTLARMAMLTYTGGKPPAGGVVVGILHARRRGMSMVYADPVEQTTLGEHSRRVFLQLARVGDGTMRPGPWCIREMCPTVGVCPARDAELLNKAGTVLAAVGPLMLNGAKVEAVLPEPFKEKDSQLTRARKLGMLYAVVQQAEKVAEAARREIRTEVLAGALPELPGGGFLVVRSHEREGLSKSSVTAAYGAVAADKLFKKLRRDGAMPKTTVERLWVEKERGS